MTHRVREGETGNQDFTLRDENGAFNGTGATGVTLVLKDRQGGVVDPTGKVAWIVQASGTVRVNPAAGDLLADRSPYSATFIVTLSSGTYAFPSTKADTWEVWK